MRLLAANDWLSVLAAKPSAIYHFPASTFTQAPPSYDVRQGRNSDSPSLPCTARQVINASNTCKMLLLRSSATVWRRSRPALARVGQSTLQQSLFSGVQAASMVSVSGFKMERNPRASTRVLFNLPKEPTTDQKHQYISFEFWEDDEPADVAWTFAIPVGEDLIDVMERYASSMRDETSDEYAGAFQGFVTNLVVQRLFLAQAIKIQSRTSRKDAELPKDGAERQGKTPVPARRVAGGARDEEIKRSLRQGQSFVDLASYFNLTSEFIFREAKRLFEQEEVKMLMRRNKKGQWSDDETQWLILRRKQGLPLTKIARLLRRTKPRIEKKLRQLGNMIFESTVIEGPQELPPGLRESLFTTRLVNVWQGLLKSDMTPTWRDALSEKSSERWLSTISEGIPEDVKRILGSLQPPTYDELERLSSVDSIDAGVYARLITSRYELQTANDRYLYIGSASKYGSGLNGRVSVHIEKRSRHDETRIRRKIRTKDLKAPGRFVTLMTMKMNSPENEDVLDVRRTVTLAEAILTVWLGALQSPCFHIQNLCPWDPQTPDYTAWSSHNPLTVDVVKPHNSKTCAHKF